jgi:hypothetical protein
MRTDCASRVAEMLVCVDFLRRGYDAVLNPSAGSPIDVLVALDDGVFLKVQVKSTSKVSDFGSRKIKLSFPMRGTSRYAVAGVDLFAFSAPVCADILYIQADELFNGRKYGHKHFGPKLFADRAPGSLDRFLRQRALLT